MLWTTALVAAVLLPHVAFAGAISDARGVWMRDDGNARVRFAPCGNKLCATNLWIKDTDKRERVGDKLIVTLMPISRKAVRAKPMSGNIT